MRAVLLAVGTELLRPGGGDTNGDWIAGRLERLGISIAWRALVADDVPVIAARLREAVREAELVVVTGGLGPTEDDRTREGLAAAVELPLERDPEMEAALRARRAKHGGVWTEADARQAFHPKGASWISNPLGAAPGLRLEGPGSLVLALPGVPAEMRAMFEGAVEPELASRRREPLAARIFKVAGRTESSVDREILDLYARPGVEATLLAKPTGIEVHLRCRGATSGEAQERLENLEGEIARRLGADLFGRDEDTLPSVVGKELLARGRTVATAESCTGGLLGGALTEVPGSSSWYRGGIVAYQDELKVLLADVRPETLARHGAVSREVAVEMAAGVRARLGSEYGVAVTGIAGPGGGSETKPVCLAFAAVVGPEGTEAVRLRLSGGRDLIRRRSVAAALDLLRRRILGP